MFIGNGDDFGNMLMNSKGTCPSCGENMTFGKSAQLAKSHGISEQVVMCPKCNRIFEIHLVPGKMSLTNDVTAKYPNVKSKNEKGGFFSRLFGK